MTTTTHQVFGGCEHTSISLEEWRKPSVILPLLDYSPERSEFRRAFTIHEPFQLRVITYLLLNSSNAQSRARFLVNLDSSRVIKQSGQVRRNSNEPIKFCQPPKRARQDSTCVISHNQRTSSSQVHVGMSLTRMTNGFQFSKQTYSDNQWFPVHCNGEKDRETPAKT